ncbi:replication initiation protein RepC [Allorhizobium sp. BGMRC 0089]|uniref:plasmid replication protein RepC n=1 Tax=Allorhizobium sonneratiae TaxID=2934936 RepID=UPI0020336B8C|nr:plasmid replication protein RepC [Allorhizobium sonneratiae]MCM2292686.1 replication initiation protein RepC [Allorhizobium sonneratiae]
MQNKQVTTPFGRRAMSFALVNRQMQTAKAQICAEAVEKWRVFRDITTARDRLGLKDRALAVLNALLSFYPETHLADSRTLVVFPSNAQLAERAHGISGTTLRRNLAALVDAGLIERRDSPNGKRYAYRSRAGEVEEAFGFNLAPLLSRAAELSALARTITQERLLLKRQKEALSICRRDVRKLIDMAMTEGLDGDWSAFDERYRQLAAPLPRHLEIAQVEERLSAFSKLRQALLKQLENRCKQEKTVANDRQSGGHKENTKPESLFYKKMDLYCDSRPSGAIPVSETPSESASLTPHIRKDQKISPSIPPARLQELVASTLKRSLPHDIAERGRQHASNPVTADSRKRNRTSPVTLVAGYAQKRPLADRANGELPSASLKRDLEQREPVFATMGCIIKTPTVSSDPGILHHGHDLNASHREWQSGQEQVGEEPLRSGEHRHQQVSSPQPKTQSAMSALPLTLVLRACPQIGDYAPGQRIRDWRDLQTAALVVARMLEISPAAYQEAVGVMGQAGAAIAIGCILERAENISCAGGYLRNLTRRAKSGHYHAEAAIMALIRTRTQATEEAAKAAAGEDA